MKGVGVCIVCLPLLEAGKVLFNRYKFPISFGGRESIVYKIRVAYLYWRQGKYCLLDTSCLPVLDAGKGSLIRYKMSTYFVGRERMVY